MWTMTAVSTSKITLLMTMKARMSPQLQHTPNLMRAAVQAALKKERKSRRTESVTKSAIVAGRRTARSTRKSTRRIRRVNTSESGPILAIFLEMRSRRVMVILARKLVKKGDAWSRKAPMVNRVLQLQVIQQEMTLMTSRLQS